MDLWGYKRWDAQCLLWSSHLGRALQCHTHPYTQWAADTSQSLLTREAPQSSLPLYERAVSQGQAPSLALFPPTIFWLTSWATIFSPHAIKIMEERASMVFWWISSGHQNGMVHDKLTSGDTPTLFRILNESLEENMTTYLLTFMVTL